MRIRPYFNGVILHTRSHCVLYSMWCIFPFLFYSLLFSFLLFLPLCKSNKRQSVNKSTTVLRSKLSHETFTQLFSRNTGNKIPQQQVTVSFTWRINWYQCHQWTIYSSRLLTWLTNATVQPVFFSSCCSLWINYLMRFNFMLRK